jgi:hypothetical protein
MEKVRELSPDDIDRWGKPLYRIYLNLNMGEKFEEIDELLEKHNREENRTENGGMHYNMFNAKDDDSIDKHLGEP